MTNMTNNDISLHQTAKIIGSFIAERSCNPDKASLATYGAEILLGSMIKIILLVAGGLALGNLDILLLIILSAGSYRMLTGGAHCTAYYRCLLASLLVFFPLSILLRNVMPTLESYPGSQWIIFIMAIVWTIRHAPLAPANKPLKGASDVKVRKLISVILLGCFFPWAVLSGLRPGLYWPIATGIFWQSFTLTPAGNTFMHKLDLMLMVKGGETGEAKQHPF
jgi:accessory gene regulator B